MKNTSVYIDTSIWEALKKAVNEAVHEYSPEYFSQLRQENQRLKNQVKILELQIDEMKATARRDLWGEVPAVSITHRIVITELQGELDEPTNT